VGTACPKIVANYDGSLIATGIYLLCHPALNRPKLNENQMKMSGKNTFGWKLDESAHTHNAIL
jgi:hypothetical protein